MQSTSSAIPPPPRLILEFCAMEVIVCLTRTLLWVDFAEKLPWINGHYKHTKTTGRIISHQTIHFIGATMHTMPTGAAIVMILASRLNKETLRNAGTHIVLDVRAVSAPRITFGYTSTQLPESGKSATIMGNGRLVSLEM